MHHAPAVSFPVGASRRAAALQLGIACAGGLCTLGWGLRFAAFDAATLVIVLAASASLALAWGAHCDVYRTMLWWEQGEWSLTDASGQSLRSGCTLAVVMDLGTLMLARCVSGDGDTTWVWLDRAADPLRWRALRRAAFDGERAVTARAPGAQA